jgi:hypothetical protein
VAQRFLEPACRLTASARRCVSLRTYASALLHLLAHEQKMKEENEAKKGRLQQALLVFDDTTGYKREGNVHGLLLSAVF